MITCQFEETILQHGDHELYRSSVHVFVLLIMDHHGKMCKLQQLLWTNVVTDEETPSLTIYEVP